MKQKKRPTRAQKVKIGHTGMLKLKQQKAALKRKKAAQKLNKELDAANLERWEADGTDRQ